MSTLQAFIAWVLAHHALFSAVLAAAVIFVNSLRVAFSGYQKTETVLGRISDALSIFTRFDSPGTLKLPLVRSLPPGTQAGALHVLMGKTPLNPGLRLLLVGVILSGALAPATARAEDGLSSKQCTIMADMVANACASSALTDGPPSSPGFDWSAGPTIPFLEYDFGNPHPFNVTPGAGVQLSLTHDNLKRSLLGKSWDLLDLELMAFGSLISSSGGQQFGVLSAAAAVCTLSSLLCVGGGRHIAGTSGWFTVFSLSLNVALAPTAPPVGISRGAAGLTRANTLYFGAP